MENSTKHRNLKRATNTTIRSLLTVAGIAGTVGVVVIAPNALQAIDYIARKVDKNRRKSKRINEQIKNSGYFNIKKISDNKYAIKLSNKGKLLNNLNEFYDFQIRPTTKWNKKWHIIMFDIPEAHRSTRDIIRTKIESLGMVLIQNSVYVYPYDVSEFVNITRLVFPHITKHLLSAELVKIDGEVQLLKAFKVKNII